MDWWLLLAVFLYIACAGLIIAEVFVPSAGLLSICALTCLVGGVWIFFHHSAAAGWIGLIAGLIMVPSIVASRTRFSRRRGLDGGRLAPPVRERGDAILDTAELKELLGRTGRVLTTMRPVGMCSFDGRRVECVAEGGYVEKDKVVKVIRVEDMQVTVRVVDEA